MLMTNIIYLKSYMLIVVRAFPACSFSEGKLILDLEIRAGNRFASFDMCNALQLDFFNK